MINRLFILFTFFTSVFVQAQYTTVINSNRPGISESPYSVGSGVYQLESSLFYRNMPHIETFSNPESFGLNMLFRTSFFLEQLEFNLNTSLSNDKIGFKNLFSSSYNTTGLSKFTLGAKYMIYAPTYSDKSKEIRSWRARHSFDWKRWIPHIGVFAGINFDNFLTDYYKKGGFSTRVGLLLQNEFSNKLNVISNIFLDKIGTDYSEYSFIVTSTYNINDYWSSFIELQGIFEKYQKKSSIGGGAAYLLNPNLQLNASVRGNLEGNLFGITSTLGVSYRLDRHEDAFVELDDTGNKIEEDKPIKYDENRNFFGRLISKIKKLFTKNKKNQKVDLDISPKNKDESGEVKKLEKPRRERQKSLVDVITKEDEKQKKKTAKEIKKAAKKAKKEKEKAAKKAKKEKEKAEKEIKKAQEKEAKEAQKEKEKAAKEIKKAQEKEAKEARKAQEKEAKKKAKEKEKLEKEIKELEEEIKEEEEKKEKEEKDDDN